MTNWLKLDEIEKKAFRSTYQDGIWDIYLGLLLLLFGLEPTMDDVFGMTLRHSTVLWLALVAGAMVFFIAGKRLITVPRIGKAEFGKERKRKKRKITLVLSASALLGVVAFIVAGPLRSAFGQNAGSIMLAVFFVNSVVVFSLMAYYLEYDRAYLWGWFFGLALPLAILLRAYTRFAFPIVVGVFSGVMIMTGLVLLVRFIRDYPHVSMPDREVP